MTLRLLESPVFLVGQAPWPAGDPLVALRPSGTWASRADQGVCPTLECK